MRLHGGPGFGGLELEEPGSYEENVAPYTAFTDVVVVVQRGFAPSRPNTECEGLKAPIFDPAWPEEARAEALRDVAADAETARAPTASRSGPPSASVSGCGGRRSPG